MKSNVVASLLADLFLAHGIQSDFDDDWVLPESSPHAIRAVWSPREDSGRLDVQVLVGDKHLIEESFAGIGAGEEGLNDALLNFTVNSFHVLLAALWNSADPSQVTTEVWRIYGTDYTAQIGNIGLRASDCAGRPLPQSLIPKIEEAIKNEHLTGNLHWFRFFFCNVAGDYTFEALRDNENWEVGREMLKGIPWESSAGYYSARLFLTLQRPQTDTKQKKSMLHCLRNLVRS